MNQIVGGLATSCEILRCAINCASYDFVVRKVSNIPNTLTKLWLTKKIENLLSNLLLKFRPVLAGMMIERDMENFRFYICFYICVVLMEISNLLNTGLDSETLVLCVKLCEAGVNPEALASVIRELRRESAAIKVKEWSDLELKPVG